jgi:hypothetical protein
MVDSPTPGFRFETTPEAILRAESVLVAYLEDRIQDIGLILAQDYADADPQALVQLSVALAIIANRLADYSGELAEPTHRELLRDAARIAATACYLFEEGR